MKGKLQDEGNTMMPAQCALHKDTDTPQGIPRKQHSAWQCYTWVVVYHCHVGTQNLLRLSELIRDSL